ncbi:hypothetical protein [Calycomorphotria hydatis]|nr:hypothetical protein [Calycomorphotria hydatis]
METQIVEPQITFIAENVITEEVLKAYVLRTSEVQISSDAVITPSAKDFIKQRRLVVTRSSNSSAEKTATTGLIVTVNVSPGLKQIVEETRKTKGVKSELMGCVSEAVQLLVSETKRAAINTGVVFTLEPETAACKANRTSGIRAVVVQDQLQIKRVRGQLNPNVWCISPEGRAYFELKQILSLCLSN